MGSQRAVLCWLPEDLLPTAMSPSADSRNGDGADLPDSTSTSFLQRLKSQRPEAWRRLVKLYGPVLYLWCRQAGLQPADAADVVQEVFVAVATHVQGFRREKPGDTFAGWLWTITRNKIRDHFRRRRGQAQGQGGTDAQQRLVLLPDASLDSSSLNTPPPDGSGLEHQVLELIRTEFEDRTWRAFLRATVQGQSAAEIAADLGMTKRAVRQAKYRVLRRLRRELADLAD